MEDWKERKGIYLWKEEEEEEKLERFLSLSYDKNKQEEE
jgi:hypothetical protein